MTAGRGRRWGWEYTGAVRRWPLRADSHEGIVSLVAQVRFEHQGSRLHAVEIERNRLSPVIESLHGALLALGIVVCSYEARPRATRLMERIVMQRRDGGSVEGALSDATKAAILPIAFDDPEPAQTTAAR